MQWECEEQKTHARTNYVLNLQLVMTMQEISGSGTKEYVLLSFQIWYMAVQSKIVHVTK